MRLRGLFVLAGLTLGAAGPALADDSLPAWNPAADHRMTEATAFTIAPVLPIPYGALQIAKLTNGARLVPTGKFLDLHDRGGTIIARFDRAGRTLERPDRPVDLVVTPTSVVFLGPGHATLMTLPRH